MWWKWTQSCIGTAEAQGNRLHKKNTPLWSALDDQSRVLEISSRQTPERPWHHMSSWRLVCQSKTLSFGAFWKLKPETENQPPGYSETLMAPHKLPDARYPNKNHWFSTIPELQDRDMGFHLLTTHETSLTPHRLMKARLHNENNRFGVVSAAPKTLHAN